VNLVPVFIPLTSRALGLSAGISVAPFILPGLFVVVARWATVLGYRSWG